MATGVNKKALYIYRLTFGNTINKKDDKLSTLLLEQGVRKEFTEGKDTYYLMFNGIKINRKIYQPSKIEVELDIMQTTKDSTGKETTKAPSFDSVTALLLQRQVKLDILEVERIPDTTRTIDYKATYNLAQNFYVHELNPQLKRDVNGTKMYVKMDIFSMDKLMTLNPYCKAYVASKLGSEILQPESGNFGKQPGGEPLIETDFESQRFLKYNESGTSHEFIQPYLVQYNESFYDFLVRTANRCGEFLYFEDGKLILGLPQTSNVETISDFETVTAQKISGDPIQVKDFTRDSVKASPLDDEASYGDKEEKDKTDEEKKKEKEEKEERKKKESELNYSRIDKKSTGFPNGVFPYYLSSNSEIAADDYIFPLVKDKFSNQKREIYADGNGSEIAMSKLIPFFKTVLSSEEGGGDACIMSLLRQIVIEEGILNLKALTQVKSVNEKQKETHLDPYDKKTEQHNDEKTVQFSSLSEAGWTKLDYYRDIHTFEVSQQRQIVCINMGTAFIPVKLGQMIHIDGIDGTYVIIQIQQNSEETWSRNYDKYDTVADDTFNGKRSLKIYAIPAYKQGNSEAFYPPVQPVPITRKVGPQTAFVTANEDPKYQGRVRIAFPWQTGNGALENKLEKAEQKLKQVNDDLEALKKNKDKLMKLKAEYNKYVVDLIRYVNATPEERKKIIEEYQPTADNGVKELEAERLTLHNQAEELKKKNPKDKDDKAKIEYLEAEIEKKNTEIQELKDAEDRKKAFINDMIAAGKEHDKKKSSADYQDPEKDNTVIRKYKKDYDEVTQQYKEAKADFERASAEQKEQEENRDALAEAIKKKMEEMSTPWVRIASPMATPGGGAFFRPRVGDEVLVNFEYDNVERPYVVGSLYSKNVLTPDEGLYRKAAPMMQQKSISMQLMSPNGHHITFSDPGSGGNFFLNCISPGLGLYGSMFGFNDFAPEAKDLAGGIHIGDRYGLYEIEMKSHSRAIDIRSPFGTVNISAFSGITISAPNGNIAIKGKNITLEAGNKITMLSGKNLQTLSADSPDGKANKAQEKAVSALGSLASELSKTYAESLFDLSLVRQVVEVFVRPVDGTMLLKSKRYLKLEAGNGNATIKRDRYKTEREKATSEEFYKALVTTIREINTKVDNFFLTYEILWSAVSGALVAYNANQYVRNLQNRNDPDLFNIVKNLDALAADTFTVDQYAGKFHDLEISDQDAFNNIKPLAKAVGTAVINLKRHVTNFNHCLDTVTDYVFDASSLRQLAKDAMAECANSFVNINDWKRDVLTNATFSNAAADAYMELTGMSRKVLKRKLMLIFLSKVGQAPGNAKDKYIKISYKLDDIKNNNTFNQDFYWKRQVVNIDNFFQKSNLLRTFMENTVLKVKDKILESTKGIYDYIKDREVWDEKKSGQILFSDQPDSTLNFNGNHLETQTSANIGTMDYLKKVLISIK